jgi:hypothetical protein
MGINDPFYDDYYLLRFLRARKFEMDKVKLMWNNFIDWRKENDVDNVIDVIYYIINTVDILI